MGATSRAFALSVSAALLLVACGGASAGSDSDQAASATPVEFPLTVENCGRRVTFEQPPERVLTLGSRMVNQVFAAGAADRIVARAAEYGQPPTGPAGDAVAGAPVLTQEEPSLEQMIGAQVDLVITQGLYETTVEDLAAAGINVLFLSGACGLFGQPGTADDADFDDVYADIELFGRIFGTQDHANDTIADLKKRVAAVQDNAKDYPFETAAALYFDGVQPWFYGNQGMPHTQMSILGLKNVFGDLDDQSAEGSIEELLARDPDVLIVVYGFSTKERPSRAMSTSSWASRARRISKRPVTTGSSRCPPPRRDPSSPRSTAWKGSPTNSAHSPKPHTDRPASCGAFTTQTSRMLHTNTEQLGTLT